MKLGNALSLLEKALEGNGNTGLYPLHRVSEMSYSANGNFFMLLCMGDVLCRWAFNSRRGSSCVSLDMTPNLSEL